MAKMQKAISSEKYLQKALVPCTEWPYKLPENWCWVKLGSISSSQYGYDAEMIADSSSPQILRITDIKGDCVAWETVSNCKIDSDTYEKYKLCTGDIVISQCGETTGSSILLNSPHESIFAQYLIRLRLQPEISVKYVYWFLQSSLYWDQISKLLLGMAQPRINITAFQSLSIPFAPIHEQQRIVDCIERLSGQLDKAKKNTLVALDSFESRKAAILHKAFSGELTEKWRKENGMGMESWRILDIAELCNSFKCGTTKKPEPAGKIAVIQARNLQNGEIDWSDLAYSNDVEDIQKYYLTYGDVLFNRINSAAWVGNTSVYRGEFPAIYDGDLVKLDYNRNRITGDFLYYALNTVSARHYYDSVKTGSVSQSKISIKKIGDYCFEVPCIAEQQEIVRILDSLFAKEQWAKESAQAVVEQIDLTKKSILSRAFCGKLGTGKSTEDSSVELLREILSKPKEKVQRKKSVIVSTELLDHLNTELEKQIIKQFLESPGKDISMDTLMSISSKKFDIMQTIRNLQNRGIIENINNKYRLRM